MKQRQLRRLTELSLNDRMMTVAEGLSILAESVRAQSVERDRIHEVAPRASLLLKSLAEEEAAKGLMLIDYLRPPSGTADAVVASHLKRVYSHMARGVYAYYYSTRPASFREVMEIVERERQSLYLDGPEGFEWIFRNSIMQRREEAMYVDWVEQEGEMRWESPEFRVRLAAGFPPIPSTIVEIFLAMHDAGLMTAQALSSLRAVWGEVVITPETRWTECLQANRDFIGAVSADGLELSDGIRQLVEWQLLFPLIQLDTSELKVDRAELEEQRDEAVRNWRPW